MQSRRGGCHVTCAWTQTTGIITRCRPEASETALSIDGHDQGLMSRPRTCDSFVVQFPPVRDTHLIEELRSPRRLVPDYAPNSTISGVTVEAPSAAHAREACSSPWAANRVVRTAPSGGIGVMTVPIRRDPRQGQGKEIANTSYTIPSPLMGRLPRYLRLRRENKAPSPTGRRGSLLSCPRRLRSQSAGEEPAPKCP